MRIPDPVVNPARAKRGMGIMGAPIGTRVLRCVKPGQGQVAAR